MASEPTSPNVVTGADAYTAVTFFKPNSLVSKQVILSYGPADAFLCGSSYPPTFN